jgi:hypothetical protein
MIEERRIQVTDREDLFSNLLKAREEEETEEKNKESNTWKFTDSDLLGVSSRSLPCFQSNNYLQGIYSLSYSLDTRLLQIQ